MINKIQLENCKIISHNKFAGKQYILRLQSFKIPQITKAGQFVHINVGGNILMRRPISIMSIDTQNNTFDLLYKIVGSGTDELSKRKVGEELSILGPIGNNFTINKKYPLLIGGGVGMPPMIALSQQISKENDKYNAFVVLASEVEFPFEVTQSKLKTNCKINLTYDVLENIGIATRLASNNSKIATDGIFKGFATDLAEKYLQTLNAEEIKEVEIFSCGPIPMLMSVKNLAKKYNISSQLSLEEHMACAVGGCAGCVIKTLEKGKEYMRKICVEGPIFNGKVVFNQ